MDDFDYWRLCEELSIFQAALLIAECDPSKEYAYVENWETHKRPKGYEAAKTGITNALSRGDIIGYSKLEAHDAAEGEPAEPESARLDIYKSRVDVSSLKSWLRKRGFRTGFFFPEDSPMPDYLDPNHPRYALKLAAAVRAWQAIEGGADKAAKSPKQLLQKWLRDHAAELGLADEDGNHNEQGIEEVAKVANWQLGGGAPRTPGG